MSAATEFVTTLIGYFLFSAGVGAMLPPDAAQKGRLYGWFYRFAQRLAANADRIAEAKFGTALVGEPGAEVADPATDSAVTTGGK